MDADSSGDHAWVFDLIDPDAGRRGAALRRHRDLMEASSAANDWRNRVWAEAGSPVPEQPHLAAEMDQAEAALKAADERSLFGPIGAFCGWGPHADPAVYSRYAPYGLLFLQWERRYPDEWHEAGTWTWSPWGTKVSLLARLARAGLPTAHRRDVTDLVVAAAEGPYRCKDWLYAPLARLVDGPDLRDRLAALLHCDDPLPRLRAEFLFHVLEESGVRVRRRSWRRWLASNPDLIARSATEEIDR